MTFFAGATNFSINNGPGGNGPIFQHFRGDCHYIYHSSSVRQSRTTVSSRPLDSSRRHNESLGNLPSTISNSRSERLGINRSESNVHNHVVTYPLYDSSGTNGTSSPQPSRQIGGNRRRQSQIRQDTPSWTELTSHDYSTDTERLEYYNVNVGPPDWIHNAQDNRLSTSLRTRGNRISTYDQEREQYRRSRERYHLEREQYRQERERYRLERERGRLQRGQSGTLPNFSINGGVFNVVNGGVQSSGQGAFVNRDHSNRLHHHLAEPWQNYYGNPDDYIQVDEDYIPPGMFEENVQRDPEILYEAPAPSYAESALDILLESGGRKTEEGGSSEAETPLYTEDDMDPISAYTEVDTMI
ncbi:uncharacterized protein C8R40DRAFT_650517 [Lentinula edodes]|uniref:uncharacterized protein n=1 Tax=Lentinula edodes TaxID=5353 RepID=UPI001E8D2CD5|nr:uncharacterized protein C8R40DRAFT_650517 [Lentinula edodes]KAH7870291.1 hypothetical protein C8R40DRAFT_650517 [Lentinula edodes]